MSGTICFIFIVLVVNLEGPDNSREVNKKFFHGGTITNIHKSSSKVYTSHEYVARNKHVRGVVFPDNLFLRNIHNDSAIKDTKVHQYHATYFEEVQYAYNHPQFRTKVARVIRIFTTR